MYVSHSEKIRKPPKSWSNLGFWPIWFFIKNNFLYLKIRNDPSNGYQESKKWAIITHYTWSWTTLRNLTKTFSKVPPPIGVSADWWVSIFVHCHLLHLHSIQFACNNVVTIPPGLPDITVVLRKTSQRKSFSFKWADCPSFFTLILSRWLWFFPGVLKFWSRPWVLLLLKVGGLVHLGTQETGSLPPRHKIACLPTKVQVATWLSTKFMFLAFPTLLTSPDHTGRWRKICIICKLAGLGDRQNLLSVRSVIEELTLTKPFKWTICQSCISQQ